MVLTLGMFEQYVLLLNIKTKQNKKSKQHIYVYLEV